MKYVLSYLLENFEMKLEQSADSVTYYSTLTLPIRGMQITFLLCCLVLSFVAIRRSSDLCEATKLKWCLSQRLNPHAAGLRTGEARIDLINYSRVLQ